MEIFTVQKESYIPDLIIGHAYWIHKIERDSRNTNKLCCTHTVVGIYCGRFRGALRFIRSSYSSSCKSGAIQKDELDWLLTRDKSDFSKCDYSISELWLNSLNEDWTDTQLFVGWGVDVCADNVYGITEIGSDTFFKIKFTQEYILNTEIFNDFDKVYVVHANGTIHTEEYQASEVSVFRYGIKFPNGNYIESADIGTGKVDICKNIINIHED